MVYAVMMCLYMATGTSCNLLSEPLASATQCEQRAAIYKDLNGPTGHGNNYKKVGCVSRQTWGWH
jgi:hypothetical protein